MFLLFNEQTLSPLGIIAVVVMLLLLYDGIAKIFNISKLLEFYLRSISSDFYHYKSVKKNETVQVFLFFLLSETLFLNKSEFISQLKENLSKPNFSKYDFNFI